MNKRVEKNIYRFFCFLMLMVALYYAKLGIFTLLEIIPSLIYASTSLLCAGIIGTTVLMHLNYAEVAYNDDAFLRTCRTLCLLSAPIVLTECIGFYATPGISTLMRLFVSYSVMGSICTYYFHKMDEAEGMRFTQHLKITLERAEQQLLGRPVQTTRQELTTHPAIVSITPSSRTTNDSNNSNQQHPRDTGPRKR